MSQQESSPRYQFSSLPGYARFLLDGHLEELTRFLLKRSFEVKLPLLSHLEKEGEEKLYRYSLEYTRQMLEAVAEERLDAYLDDLSTRILKQQVLNLNPADIQTRDISLIGQVRRQSLRHFIPRYTDTLETALTLSNEVDALASVIEELSYQIVFSHFKTHLHHNEEQLLRAQSLAQLGHWVLDANTGALTWSRELYRIYELEPGTPVTREIAKTYNHPDDQERIEAEVSRSATTGTLDFIYRLLMRDGRAKFIHARGGVEKNESGEVTRYLGTVQDVTERQELVLRLQQWEETFKQAEHLANIGSWSWDVHSGELEWSDQLYRIYGLEPGSEKITIDRFLRFLHPEDRPGIELGLDVSRQGDTTDYTFRIILEDGTVKTLRSIAAAHRDANGQLVRINGTEQDITEHRSLLEDVRQSELLFRQAQALAKVGNWHFDAGSGTVSWSDELYRIYGMDPQSEHIDYATYLSFIHPEDSAGLTEKIGLALTEGKPYEVYHRIVWRNGEVRVVHSYGDIVKNGEGKTVALLGTAQDVTEREELIQKLQESEHNYRQAQAMAHLGNWQLDLDTMEMTWSEEMFHIYEEVPRPKVSLSDLLEYVAEEDREALAQYHEECLRLHRPYDRKHCIRFKDGRTKLVHRRGAFVFDAHGKAVAMVGTTQDITEREKLIQQLEESQKLYQQAQAMASLGNFSWNLGTGKVYWSEEVYRIYGREQGTPVTFEDAFTPIHPEYQAAVQEAIQQTMGEKSGRRVTYAINVAGTEKFINLETEVVLGEGGEVTYINGTAQDITSSYLVQRQLEENQRFIRKIADATPSIISTWRVRDGAFTFLSEGVTKLLGYPTEEMLQGGLAFVQNIIHPDDLSQLADGFARMMVDRPEGSPADETAEFQFRIRHLDGSWKWLHSYGTVFDRNARGRVEQLLNISLDVTEQVEATERIREQDHLISHIADASPTILYMYDIASASVAYANREVFFVLGYRPEELVEMGAAVTEELYHPDDIHLLPGRPGSTKNFHQADTMMQYECRIRNKGGEWTWMLVREIVFKAAEDGSITQILGAALDISKRKDMERTILQNAFQLEQSNASLEEFAYVASHDLKEPLRKISTFGDRLAATQEAHLTADGKIYLQKIVDASQRMQRMINDLLSISMISGNRSYEPADLQEILEETLQALEHKMEKSGAIVESDGLPVLHIIPSQFRQLFQNLLSNSLKFVRDDEPPHIRLSHRFIEPGEEALPNLPPASRYVRIDVQDNGIGFEKEYAGKIFAIFQRLHGRSEYEGSGIGLAICKKIVEHHQGLIYAQGEPGAGATFTLILPA